MIDQGNIESATARTVTVTAPPVNTGDEDSFKQGSRWGRYLSPKNIGTVYVLFAIIVLFSILKPVAFPTAQTAASILNQSAITGVAALALVVPLAAGVFDLSMGSIMGFAGVLMATLLNVTDWSPVVCVIITLVTCAVLGLVNGFVVVGLRVNSFIGTLGTGAIFAALALAISGGQVVVGRIGEGFTKFSTQQVFGVHISFLYLVVIMIGLGYWLERTKQGRQIYATGFDHDAAWLTGAPVDRLVVLSLVTSASIGGFAGIMLAAQVASANAVNGSSYLIPAFSAAFLASTQFGRKRFNSWGTVIAVLLLTTGNVGLIIIGGPSWTPQLFTGVVLIAAVALSGQTGLRFLRRFKKIRTPRHDSPSA